MVAEEFERPGENPVTGERVVARRRRISHDSELPMKDAYSAFIRERIEREGAGHGSVGR
ncbi:hypothetical protein BSF38_05436 [Paludisphaera borealis]|uniref:Uncharacterized protein n=1 Tax=Paludisphaera borealis TaxID=1387353 RepID=A0A1U7CY77_9BACT|nr:hypothetical protein BSF38_05436 [Paludisphaera borealis]